MRLRLYNTYTRAYEEIQQPKDRKLGVYCCGPTVYGPAHVGNFRTYVIQDSVLRLLKLLSNDVCYVRNLTDVDDKTIRGARDAQKALSDYTQHWIEVFQKDCDRLNLLPPTVEPRATATIEAQQDLIKILIQKGHAYERGGSVYFKVSSFKDYGRLSHLDARKLETQSTNSAGRSNDADEYDRDQVADFVLWKAYKPEDGDIFWNSPWGKGRPGWHIECSAMSHEYLGKTVDLHTGGVDLCFPHHENEIAQSEAAYGGPFVRHWMHIAHLKVEGQKMSKSLGNLLTLDMLQDRQYTPSAVRYALLAGHYRQPLNFTFDLLKASQVALQKIHAFSQKLAQMCNVSLEQLKSLQTTIVLPKECRFLKAFFEALCEDLNTPKALGCLFLFIRKMPTVEVPMFPLLLKEWAACLYALGIDLNEALQEEEVHVPLPVRRMAEQRWQAKLARDFKAADDIRKILEESGWKILDSKDSYKVLPL